jgi:hypothetical protein
MDDVTNQGYGGVIRRSTGHWQGFFIPVPKDAAEQSAVDDALEVAKFATKDILSMDRKRPILPLGGLTATLVQFLYEEDWGRVATVSAAITKLSGARFWIVAAESDGEGGFETNFQSLSAKTVDEARDMINALGKASQMDLLLKQGAS